MLIFSHQCQDLLNIQEWLAPAKPLLMIRFCGTTPNSTALGPLLRQKYLKNTKKAIKQSRSICMQICYTDMLPFEEIPDDTVPVTAYLKVKLSLSPTYKARRH